MRKMKEQCRNTVNENRRVVIKISSLFDVTVRVMPAYSQVFTTSSTSNRAMSKRTVALHYSACGLTTNAIKYLLESLFIFFDMKTVLNIFN